MFMRKTLKVCLYTLAALAVLALFSPMAARAEIVFPEGTGQIGQRYLEYTAGQPMTLRIDMPHYSTTGKAIRYEWKYDDYNGGDPVFTPIATTSEPFCTFTPLASDHGRMLAVDVLEVGSDGDGVGFSPILLDRSRSYPQLPKETGERWREYQLCRNESVMLSLPEATARESGKTLEYRWYAELPGGGSKLWATTDSPTLTVRNDGTIDIDEFWWLGFFCHVGYAGDEDSFLRYAPYFTVDFYSFTDFKVTTQEKPVVPEAAKKRPDVNVNTVAELEVHMFEELKKEEPSFKDESASHHLYEVTLQFFDGQKWFPATSDNYPDSGIWVTLPYPEGIDYWNYDFKVIHMFSFDIRNHKAGDTECLEPIKTPDGLRVCLGGASPVLVAWQRTAGAPSVTPHQTSASVPTTGDGMPLGAFAALLAFSACGMAALVYVFRKKRA